MDDHATEAMRAGASYYEENYPNYEAQNPPAKLDFYAATVNRLKDPSCPKRLHDLGCAFGKFLQSLDPSWEIFGSDANPYAIEQAKRRVPRGHFAHAPAAADPVFAEKFGVVTAFDVLEHVPDLEAAAKGIEAQLLPKGLLVFVVPVYDGATGPVVRLLDKDPTHVHKEPRAFWTEWAARHFEVLHWEGVLRYLLPGGVYLHVPSKLMRRHMPAILVACRRR